MSPFQREIVLYHGSPIMFRPSPQEIVIRMVFAVASLETTPLFTLVRLQLSRFRRVMCRADFSIRDPDGPTTMLLSFTSGYCL